MLIRHSKTDEESKGTVQFLGKPTTERIQAWLLNSRLAEGALFRAVNRAGASAGQASDGQEHPGHYQATRQGRRHGRPG